MVSDRYDFFLTFGILVNDDLNSVFFLFIELVHFILIITPVITFLINKLVNKLNN